VDAREQRGIIIAAMCRVERKADGTFLVPSQSLAEKRYEVRLDGEGTCTCPDHSESGFCCKHIRAVRIVVRRETNMDGSITETKSITFEEKKIFSQDWPAYDRAQKTERKRVQVLLADLCKNLPEFERPPGKTGPKPHSVKDSVFSMCLKVYGGLSGRRTQCDLDDAFAAGYLERPMPCIKVATCFENPAYKPILTDLVAKSALPLVPVETNFAVDSTGFSSSRFETWWDHKYGVNRRKCMWVKVHCVVGTKTNVVTAVRILDKDANDCPQFVPLMQTTRERFDVKEVAGDSAYLSVENVEDTVKHDGTPFILPKSNTTGGVGGLFEKMFHYFQFRKDEFMEHYHRRSNIEATWSALKRKFGDSVRSRTDAAMVNECLCKLLCFNLTCVIQEQEVLGIAPVFWPEEVSGDEPALLPMERQQ
jgi:transposase